MSDYCRNLVLRYPIKKKDRESLDNILENNCLGHQYKDGYFETCCAVDAKYECKYFLDYVIHSTYGEECGDFGKVRDIYPAEIEEFKPLFELLIPNIDMSKVKVVDYCWYNCSEPPAYYDEIDDPFYKKLEAPRAVWKRDTSEIFVTPGGDPVVVCSRCGGGKHVYGIEHSKFIDTCPQCGARMTLPFSNFQ